MQKLPLMAAWDVDAAITVETRTSLLEAGARSLALRDVGYEVHWGPFQPKKQDKQARPYTPAGGTAISLKGSVKPVDFSRDGELAQLLADSRRFVHAGLPYGRGADCVHLMGFLWHCQLQSFSAKHGTARASPHCHFWICNVFGGCSVCFVHGCEYGCSTLCCFPTRGVLRGLV